jgi:hypothetical protein
MGRALEAHVKSRVQDGPSLEEVGMRTVIVRLFEPTPTAGDVGLRGFVEDVSGGSKASFEGAHQLLEALEQITRHPVEEGVIRRDDGQEPPR